MVWTSSSILQSWLRGQMRLYLSKTRVLSTLPKILWRWETCRLTRSRSLGISTEFYCKRSSLTEASTARRHHGKLLTRRKRRSLLLKPRTPSLSCLAFLWPKVALWKTACQFQLSRIILSSKSQLLLATLSRPSSLNLCLDKWTRAQRLTASTTSPRTRSESPRASADRGKTTTWWISCLRTIQNQLCCPSLLTTSKQSLATQWSCFLQMPIPKTIRLHLRTPWQWTIRKSPFWFLTSNSSRTNQRRLW